MRSFGFFFFFFCIRRVAKLRLRAARRVAEIEVEFEFDIYEQPLLTAAHVVAIVVIAFWGALATSNRSQVKLSQAVLELATALLASLPTYSPVVVIVVCSSWARQCSAIYISMKLILMI